jgi:hypothetical protein
MIKVDLILTIVLRVLVCPFVFCTVFIRMLYNPFYFTAMFLLYGGEHISYVAKDKKQIYDLYQQLLKDKECSIK